MGFNSLSYAFFVAIVFVVYWFPLRRNLRLQNLFLLLSSLCFYSLWDWRFTGLLMAACLVTWFVGSRIRDSHFGRLWLVAGVTVDLAILVVFKYFNFFSHGLSELLSLAGFAADWVTIDILLPVGVSFFTLQSISYLVDVYRRVTLPSGSVVVVATYLSFFPQLVAGPIERPQQLIGQLQRKRAWDYPLAVEGMRQILWGLFKKLAVADLCGLYVDRILGNTGYYGASTIVFALFLFTFQIYGDFSGYSDIAIGTAKLLGIRLTPNFRYPLWSASVAEFWRRWHITLMNWFRDYVYIPMGGSRRGTVNTAVNITVVFLLSGLWHGASFNFVMWGLFWAVIMNIERIADIHFHPTRLFGCLCVNIVLAASWVLFRPETLADSALILRSVCRASIFEMPTGLTPLMTVVPMLIAELLGRYEEFPLKRLMKPVWARWLLYAAIFYSIVFAVDSSDPTDFIYFQF